MKYRHTDSNLEKDSQYPKLVRDKIPEVAEKENGYPIKMRVMKTKKEFDCYLRAKIVEEAEELRAAKGRTHIAEEAADLMELIETVLAENKLTLKEMRSVQKRKLKERGGFRKKILMLGKKK